MNKLPARNHVRSTPAPVTHDGYAPNSGLLCRLLVHEAELVWFVSMFGKAVCSRKSRLNKQTQEFGLNRGGSRILLQLYPMFGHAMDLLNVLSVFGRFVAEFVGNDVIRRYRQNPQLCVAVKFFWVSDSARCTHEQEMRGCGDRLAAARRVPEGVIGADLLVRSDSHEKRHQSARSLRLPPPTRASRSETPPEGGRPSLRSVACHNRHCVR